jgi:protein translocase SEC61 complex gamma subunit, archaeal and eukaryotic
MIKMNLNIISIFKSFFSSSKRIINISYKPSRHEFNKSIRIIIIGILIIGLLGFVMSIIIGLLAGTPILP